MFFDEWEQFAAQRLEVKIIEGLKMILPSGKKTIDLELAWPNYTLHINAQYDRDYYEALEKVAINLRDKITGRSATVFAATLRDKWDIELIEPNQWVTNLEPYFRLAIFNNNAFEFVNDDYLFPELVSNVLKPTMYPMKYGKKGREWRAGSSEIERIVEKTVGNHARGRYEDERISIHAIPTKTQRVGSIFVNIRAPFALPNCAVLTVLRMNLRGGYMFSDRFKPGKWIYYLNVLSEKKLI